MALLNRGQRIVASGILFAAVLVGTTMIYIREFWNFDAKQARVAELENRVQAKQAYIKELQKRLKEKNFSFMDYRTADRGGRLFYAPINVKPKGGDVMHKEVKKRQTLKELQEGLEGKN